MNSKLYKFFVLIITTAFILGACGTGGNNNTTAGPTPSESGPGDVIPTTISVPNPAETTKAYLDAWNENDRTTMYNLLTKVSIDSYSFENFEDRYDNISLDGAVTHIEYEILSALTNPTTAQVSYQITLNSALVGPIIRNTQMDLSLEDGQWHIVWDDSIILPELTGGNRLAMQRYTPTRGIIYDINHDPLVADGDSVAISVIPSLIEEDDGNGILSQLSVLTNYDTGWLASRIFQDDPPFIIPIAEVALDNFENRKPFLDEFGVFRYDEYFTRLYYAGAGGANAVGYTQQIPIEELDKWTELGYPVDAKIGRIGLELWGEEYLSGQRGGELLVVTPDTNDLVTILGSRDAQPSSSIYSTFDTNLMFEAQRAIKDFTGAIVVLERDTGRVLAMVSSPTFNPNDADFNNPIGNWGAYFPDTEQRFFNRATQGQYPPGSIFKVITLAAALESARWTPQSSLFCGHTWIAPDGAEYKDWTLDKGRPASGELSLLGGLMRSCNPWFYEIGSVLYSKGETTLVSDMARGFGLGSPTGLVELPEATGQIINPDDLPNEGVFNAFQQSIGQSDTLITPIQAAVYVAALGNGGTLYRPQMVEYVENTNGDQILVFEPDPTGVLPISENTLTNIQTGMRMVTNNARGTAYRTFSGLAISVYGKTGTAQVGDATVSPHAWFIGYTNQNRNDLPDIAIAVLVENAGDGSEFAAPIFRRVVESYFFRNPQARYPWEESVGVLDSFYFLPEELQDAIEATQAAEEAEGDDN